MEFRNLGSPVCQIAFLALTGIRKWMLAQCRDGDIQGTHPFLSAGEMGLHASLRRTDGGSLPTYLSARQWLEQYASSHPEMSPMDEKAYLPSGRMMIYYYQYRRDMIERSEADLGRKVPEEPLLGSTPGQCSEPPAPPPPSVGHCSERPPPPPPSVAQIGRTRNPLGENPPLGSIHRCANYANGVSPSWHLRNFVCIPGSLDGRVSLDCRCQEHRHVYAVQCV